VFSSLVPEAPSAVIASSTVAFAAALALAAGSLVEEAFSEDSYVYFATVVITGAFCFILVGGYVSTLVFGCLFVAAIAVAVHGLAARSSLLPFVGSTFLLGIAGLAHPIFWVLAAPLLIVAGLALGPGASDIWLRTRRLPTRTIVLGSATGGAVLTLAGLAATGWIARTPLETSADAVLRNLQPQVLLSAYRTRLAGALAAARPFLWLAGICLLAFVWTHYRRPRRGRLLSSAPSRFGWALIVAWLGITAIGAAALEVGASVPAQRLVNFCLAVPLLTGGALLQIRLPATGWWRQALTSLTIVAAVGSTYIAWHAWSHHQPPSSDTAVVEAAAAGHLFAGTPPGTRLVVATDTTHKPAQRTTTVANLLRDYIPERRLSDVHIYLGRPQDLLADHPTLTGQLVHDQLSIESWRAARASGPHRVALVLRALDPTSYASLAHIRNVRAMAPGVLAFEGADLMSRASGVSPAPLWSSWTPVWLSPLLLLGLSVAGLPWVGLLLPQARLRTKASLAPAFGIGAVAAGAIVVDAVGFRLAGPGGWIAVLAFGAGPLLLWSGRRYNRAATLRQT
jgi:hypothetical protein